MSMWRTSSIRRRELFAALCGPSCVLVLLCLLNSGCRDPKTQKQGSPTNPQIHKDHLSLIAPSPAEDPVAGDDWQKQLDAVRHGQSYSVQLAAPATEAFLNQLPELDGKLLELMLDGGGIDDALFPHLAKLKSLEHLRIRNSPITDSGIEQFAHADLQLQILNLPQARITTRGVAALAILPNLRQLRLGGSQIDDDAAEKIAGLPALQSLHLIGPTLTASGLEQLSGAKKLASLYIDDCTLPDEAWERVFQAKPNLHVHIDQHHHDRDPHADSH